MLHTHEVTGSSPVVSTNKKPHPCGVVFCWLRNEGTRTHLNATVQWTVASRRLSRRLLHNQIESRSLQCQNPEFVSEWKIVVYRADSRPATVGEALSLPPGFSTECSVEWYKCGKLVRIRPSWLVTESLYCAGGYEPPLQWLVQQTSILGAILFVRGEKHGIFQYGSRRIP